MDVRTFVSTTLTQILDGIRDAQRVEGGSDVAAEGYIYQEKSNVIAGGDSGFFTIVDFDISVLAETKEAGQSVRVADVHSADGNTKMAQNASRVRFAVHLRLPKGGGDRAPRRDFGSVRARSDFVV